MNQGKKNIFKKFIQGILDLPLWVKQIVYLELKEEFESDSSKRSLNFIKKDDCLQTYIPRLTFIGKKELETKAKKLQPVIYKFIEDVTSELSVIEIASNNGWSLAETASCIIMAMNNELLINPESVIVKGTALYLSGKIRLGEYFVKLGKITIEQLDEALRTQKYIEETIGDKTGLAEVLINLGYVTKDDTEAILLLKDEGSKRYNSNNDSNLNLAGSCDETTKLREQLTKISKENMQLKEQIKKILKIG
ncbi:MAG: hypothetical protein WCK67_07360 [bacterium]